MNMDVKYTSKRDVKYDVEYDVKTSDGKLRYDKKHTVIVPKKVEFDTDEKIVLSNEQSSYTDPKFGGRNRIQELEIKKTIRNVEDEIRKLIENSVEEDNTGCALGTKYRITKQRTAMQTIEKLN